MDARTQKIVGYGLLCAGLVLIVAGIWNCYAVLTAAADAPAVLTLESVVVKVAGAGATASDIELVSGEAATKMANLVVWYILMFFLVSAGAKICSLGIQMIKDTVVKISDRS